MKAISTVPHSELSPLREDDVSRPVHEMGQQDRDPGAFDALLADITRFCEHAGGRLGRVGDKPDGSDRLS